MPEGEVSETIKAVTSNSSPPQIRVSSPSQTTILPLGARLILARPALASDVFRAVAKNAP